MSVDDLFWSTSTKAIFTPTSARVIDASKKIVSIKVGQNIIVDADQKNSHSQCKKKHHHPTLK